MSSAQNTFNYVVGGLALVTTITSVLTYCGHYMPVTRLGLLDDLLSETKKIYHKVNGESLLSPDVSTYAKTTLNQYEAESDKLREVIYRARSYFGTLRTLFDGQAGRITDLTEQVAELRSFVMTASQEEKMRQARKSGLSPPLSVSDASARPLPGSCTGGDNHADSDYGHETTSSFVSCVHPSLLAGTDSSTGTGNRVPSDLPTFSSPLDKNRPLPTSTCFLCSFVGWWRRKLSRTLPALPKFAARGGHQGPPIPNGTSPTRNAMMAEEPTRSASPPRFLYGAPVCDWTSLAHWTNHEAHPSELRRDPTIASPV